MQRRTHARLARLVLAMLFAAAVAGVAAVSPVDDSRAAARDWAAAEAAAGRLPVTLDALENYPVSYRKAAFHLLDPAPKSALVQEHLTMVLADPSLTPDQRKAIQEMRALAVPTVYDIGNPGRQALQGAINAICVRTERLFSNDQAWMTKSIGRPNVEAQPGVIVASLRATRNLLLGVPVNADLALCRCSTQSSCDLCDDPPEEACTTNGTNCTQIEECGCIFTYTCDRECVPYVEGK